ncbi:hypothetical protein KCU72_g23, partial [Aureobasidium melanogenum]
LHEYVMRWILRITSDLHSHLIVRCLERDAKRNRAGDAKSPRHRAQSEASERRLHSSNLNNDSRTCKMALWAPLTLCRFSDRAIMHSGLRSSLRSLR